MTPRTPLVPICARRPPIPVSSLEDFFYGFQACDYFLPQRGEDPVADYLNGLGGGCRSWGGLTRS